MYVGDRGAGGTGCLWRRKAVACRLASGGGCRTTPIISPRGDGWESAGTFNPAVIVRNDKIVMLYRAQDKTRHFAAGIRRERRWNSFHEARRAGSESLGGLRERRRGRGSAAGSVRRHVLSHLHRLQQERCSALPRDVQRPDSLGSQGRDHSGEQGKLECEMDQVGRDRSRKRSMASTGCIFLGRAQTTKIRLGWRHLDRPVCIGPRQRQTPVLPVGPSEFDSRVAEPGPAPIVDLRWNLSRLQRG